MNIASSILAASILALGIALAGSPVKPFDRNAGGSQSPAGFAAIDGHTHDLVPRGGKPPEQSGIERAAAAGLRGAVLAFPRETTTPAGLLRQIQIDREAVRAYAARKAVDVAFVDRFDLTNAGAGSRAFQILASLEYFDGVFGGGLAALDALYGAGIRSVTIVDYPGDNLSQGKGDALCLSEFGRRVVGRMNELSMAIDISHLPEPLQRDVIRTSSRPVIASHSNAREVAAVGRNLSDGVLRELSGRGGLVLFTFDREFLFGTGDIQETPGLPQLLKHISHVVRLCGGDHVGLGSDYLGSGRNAPADLRGVECFQAIAENLAKAGYPPEAVRKIMGENLADFFSGPGGEKKTALPKLTGWSAPAYAGPGMYLSSNRSGRYYTMEIERGDKTKFFLAEVAFGNGRLADYQRLKISPHYERQTHPCIAPDGGFLIYDTEAEDSRLYASFKDKNGDWGEGIDLSRHGFKPGSRGAYISPDGKYLFFGYGGDIWWADIRVIERLRPKRLNTPS